MQPAHVDLLYRAITEGAGGFERMHLGSTDDGQALTVRKGKRRSSMQAHSLHPLPLLTGGTWAYGGAIHLLESDPEAVVDDVPRTSPWAGILALAQALIESYQERRRLTEENGVQVHDTGFVWWVVLIVVLIVVAVVAELTITLLCASGVIKDATTCTIGLVLLFVGLFMGCVQSGGEVGTDDGGVNCTKTWGSDGTDG